MQTVTPIQQSPRFWAGLWDALTSLQFITSFFGWFFMLLSRLAEPLMSLSAIYIIICAGIPQWKLDDVYNIGVAVMIAAPEIILPGAFVLAGQYSERKDKRAGMLYWVAWLFVALTFFTLADLFIFHLEGAALNALMWGRCAVGISYSILLRVLTHDGHTQETTTRPAQAAPVIDYAEIARHLRAFFPQEAPQPKLDYEELARQLVPLMPVPQVDYQELALYIGATFTATIRDGLGAIGSHAARREPEPLREPVARIRQPRPRREPVVLLPGAGDGERESRLQNAYDRLTGLGLRVSGRNLAEAAHVKRVYATAWLQAKTGATGEAEPEDEREPQAM
jgi:hypothetical protein